DIPAPDLVRLRRHELVGPTRSRGTRAAAVLHLVGLPQDTIEARLAGDVLAAVGERGDDLLGAFVAKFGGVRDFEDLRLLGLGELVRGRMPRACAAIDALVVLAPALERTSADADDLARLLDARPGRDGLVDERDGHSSLSFSVSSSSSSQRAWTFFWSTSNAAASARALFLRCNSFSSFLTRRASCERTCLLGG